MESTQTNVEVPVPPQPSPAETNIIKLDETGPDGQPLRLDPPSNLVSPNIVPEDPNDPKLVGQMQAFVLNPTIQTGSHAQEEAKGDMALIHASRGEASSRLMALRLKEGLFTVDYEAQTVVGRNPLLKTCSIALFTHNHGRLLIGVHPAGITAFDPLTNEPKHELAMANIQNVQLSPNEKYLQIWTKVDKDMHNIHLLELETFTITTTLAILKFKKENWPLFRFTPDDSRAIRCNSNALEVFEIKTSVSKPVDEVKLELVDVFSISPCKSKSLIACGAVQNITKKNIPKLMFIDLNNRGAMKTFEVEKAHEINFIWAPDGEIVLIWCQTLHDETGKSYYGEHNLYYYNFATEKFQRVEKPEGPVHDVSWDPRSEHFALIAGFMPASCNLFDRNCTVKFDFGGKLYVNTLRWSPLSRFLLLGGFGNLSGNIQIWDIFTITKMGDCRSSSAIMCQWAPDGRKFFTSIVNPRLRVDNGYKIFKYTGELLGGMDLKTTELYEVLWRPGKFEDRPPSGRKMSTQSEATALAKPKRIMKLREDVDFVKGERKGSEEIVVQLPDDVYSRLATEHSTVNATLPNIKPAEYKKKTWKKHSVDNLETSPPFQSTNAVESQPYVPQQPQNTYVPKKNPSGGPYKEHDYISQTGNYSVEHERSQKAVYVAKKNSPAYRPKDEGRRPSYGNAAPVYVEKKQHH